MKLKIFSLALLVIVTTIAPRSLRAQYLHPKVAKKEVSIRNVVILPARVQIVKQSMKGPESMVAESDLLSARVAQLIVDVLQAKHIAASSIAPTGANEADAQKKYTLADIQSRYDDLLPKIRKKPKDVKNGRFSLGDEILNLNLDKSADTIVFVRGSGQKLTKGKTAFTLLVGGVPPYLQLTIGFVDAHTGDVMVFTTPIIGGDATSPNEKPLRKAIEKSLKKVPPGS